MENSGTPRSPRRVAAFLSPPRTASQTVRVATHEKVLKRQIDDTMQSMELTMRKHKAIKAAAAGREALATVEAIACAAADAAVAAADLAAVSAAALYDAVSELVLLRKLVPRGGESAATQPHLQPLPLPPPPASAELKLLGQKRERPAASAAASATAAAVPRGAAKRAKTSAMSTPQAAPARRRLFLQLTGFGADDESTKLIKDAIVTLGNAEHFSWDYGTRDRGAHIPTHLVASLHCAPTNLKVFAASLAGVWIVDVAWVQASVMAGRWVDESAHGGVLKPRFVLRKRVALTTALSDALEARARKKKPYSSALPSSRVVPLVAPALLEKLIRFGGGRVEKDGREADLVVALQSGGAASGGNTITYEAFMQSCLGGRDARV